MPSRYGGWKQENSKETQPFQLGNSLGVVVTSVLHFQDCTTHFSGDLIFYPIFSIDRTATHLIHGLKDRSELMSSTKKNVQVVKLLPLMHSQCICSGYTMALSVEQRKLFIFSGKSITLFMKGPARPLCHHPHRQHGDLLQQSAFGQVKAECMMGKALIVTSSYLLMMNKTLRIYTVQICLTDCCYKISSGISVKNKQEVAKKLLPIKSLIFIQLSTQ